MECFAIDSVLSPRGTSVGFVRIRFSTGGLAASKIEVQDEPKEIFGGTDCCHLLCGAQAAEPIKMSCDIQPLAYRNCDSSSCDEGTTVGKGMQTPFRFVKCDTGCSGNVCDLDCGCGKNACDNGCCGNGCDSNGCDGFGGCDSGLLGLGIVKKSESCFDDFISPMTNPVYFEDPRQLTEARLIFINHKLPFLLNAPAGRIQLYALQVRLRLTEKLSFIAVKDGFVVSDSPLIDDGWADISAGLKYTLYRDACRGRMLSAGARFETYSGTPRTLQGNGDGVFDFFLSGGSRLGSCNHYLTSAGSSFRWMTMPKIKCSTGRTTLTINSIENYMSSLN